MFNDFNEIKLGRLSLSIERYTGGGLETNSPSSPCKKSQNYIATSSVIVIIITIIIVIMPASYLSIDF